MCKTKLSDLSTELIEEKKQNVELKDSHGKLKFQLQKYKTIRNELKERVARLKEDLKMQRDRSSEAKKKESLALEDKLGKFERDKIATEIQLNEYKTISGELIEKEKKKESLALEDKLGKIESEEDSKSATERINVLTNNLEKYKVKCSELLIVCEEKKKENSMLEEKLSKLKLYNNNAESRVKQYMRICDEFRIKTALAEEQFEVNVVYERERTAAERIKILSDELDKTNKDTAQKLIKLDNENQDLKCAKRKAEEELEVRKKRFKVFEIQVKKYLEEQS
ncbi:hypothetical protein IFM89_026204 [Coptis chinensis]|uniref:Uncharacterized protein n=1 Tax=Coptis chinensis TaxID=261450 RepID=A0A835IG08_9MAGN|nr:hypothetical protein IFM89_026204 [Coptis chinensis]